MRDERDPRPSALEVRGLEVERQNRPVLDGLDLTFGGGVLAVLGPNGAGKTTLLSAIVTLLEPSAGTIHVAGLDAGEPSSRNAVRGVVGFQPQTPVHAARFTLLESVVYAGWLKGMSTSAARSAAGAALRNVNLHDRADRRADRLSGGQAKRLAIAQALVHQPSLLVLDEPTASLDPSERAELLSLLTELATRTDVVYSTHIATDVRRLADEVLVVAAGRARYHGAVEDFLGESVGDSEAQVEAAYARILAQAEIGT